MNFYNMLFGMNAQSDLLLAVIGLRKSDVERFRDCFVSDDGATIQVYTRTGGGNREDYPNLTMRALPSWRGSEDDDFDCTYCTDTFAVPVEFVDDVKGLSDILSNGLRTEFAQYLGRTLRRPPTDTDKNAAAYESERAAIGRLRHSMANGHTFVPHDDYSAEQALKLAEANGGKLRSCWGILPLVLEVKRDFIPFPNARDDGTRLSMTRVKVNCLWKIDAAYWAHMQERWSSVYPLAMAEVAESVRRVREAA